MAKVKLLTSMASPDGYWPSGDVLDLEPTDAERMVRAGAAEYLQASASTPPAPDEVEIETPEKKLKTKQAKR